MILNLILILIPSYPYPYPYSTNELDPNPSSNHNPNPTPNPDPKPNPNSVGLVNLFWILTRESGRPQHHCKPLILRSSYAQSVRSWILISLETMF